MANTTDAVNDDNNTLAGMPVSGSVATNDFDPQGDLQTFQGFEDPANPGTYVNNGTLTTIPGIDSNGNPIADAGDLSINPDGSYTFTPAPGFTGSVSIDYQVCDDGTPQACDRAVLTIDVAPLSIPGDPTTNDVIANDDDAVSYGSAASGNLHDNDRDPNGDPLALTGYTYDSDGDGVPDSSGSLGSPVVVAGVDADGNPVSNAGSLTINPDGTYTYTPAPGFIGTVTAQYEICDNVAAPNQACDTATLTIKVLADDPDGDGNNPPFAGDDFEVTGLGGAVSSTVLPNDSDPDGDLITVTEVNGTPVNPGGTTVPTTNGSVTINPDGTYTYTPNPGYEGPDSFDYQICDPSGACAEATVYILTTSAAPVCGDGIIETGETCEPNGVPQPPNDNLCRTDCTFCGDGVINGPAVGPGHETCDDGNTENADDCTNSCRGTLRRDPAVIRFYPDKVNDRLKVTGRINKEDSLRASDNVTGIRLYNETGLIFAKDLAAGRIVDRYNRGRIFKFMDKTIAENPLGGIGEFKVYKHRGWYYIKVVAYGDLTAATSADMTLVIRFGENEYVSLETWQPTRTGWKAVFIPPR